MAEPTVIDSLIVTLGLDPANFDQGRKKAAADFVSLKSDAAGAAKELEARGKQAAQFYGSIKREALGLFAVVTGAGGLERFTTATVTNFAAIGRAAKTIGVATSELSAFQNLIVRGGGTADAARSSLQGLAKSLQEWKVLGNTAALPYLNRIGAGANDNALEVYAKYAKYAATVKPATAKLVGQGLGLDDVSIDQALKGQAAFQTEMAKSRKLGVPTEDDVRKTNELQRQFFTLRQGLTGNAQAILEDWAPAMSTLLSLVNQGVDAFPGLTKGVIGLGVALTGLSALKFSTSLLALLKIGAKGGAAAGSVGAGIDALVAGGVAAVAPAAAPLALAYELFHPDAANKGEAEALANARRKGGQGPLSSMAGVLPPKAGAPGHDRDMAIRTLIGEARVGDFQGMKDVAHVIKNRMSVTGKGAADIVLQPGQFEPWMTAKRKAELMAVRRDSPAYKLAEKAWGDAVNEKDPTSGATLFVSPSGQAANGRNMPAWASPEAMTLARGGHQFYKGGFAGGSKVDRSMHVGSVTVVTQATDAQGIAQDFHKELERQNLANQVNTGLF